MTADYPLPSSIVSSGARVLCWGPNQNLWFGGQGYIAKLDPSISPS